MLPRIKELLTPPQLENEKDALSASLLHTILLILAAAGFIVPLVLNIVALADPNDDINFNLGTFLMGIIVPSLALVLIRTAKRGRVQLASAIITGTLFLLTTSTIATFRGTRDTAAGMYILVISMAGLLLGGRAALIFTFLSLGVTFVIYLAETNGLLTITLSPTPEIVEWIIFAVVVLMIGILLRFAFDTLNQALHGAQEANEELERVQASLADRVAARTRDLELAAEVGRNLSRMRQSEEILLEAVESIRSRFDLYYTQIYLVDSNRNNLILRAGTGSVGRQLRQLGHRLPLSTSSINGTAVINKEPVIVSDTTKSGIFRQNPMLPDTRSEMAIPLIVSGDVIGSLNLQSVHPEALAEENLPAFEALAGQLAVALENARLFTETAETQNALETLAQRLTRSNWDSYLNAIDHQENINYTYNLTRTKFVTEEPAEIKENPSFAVPIRVGNEILGNIEITGNEWNIWQKEHKELADAVAQRVAQQVENIRLLSETERYRAEAEEATRRLTREGWEAYIQDQMNQPDGFMYDRQEVIPLPAENGHPKEPGLVKDLTIRGESIGQFEIEGIQESDEEAAGLVNAVAERLSAHIENLRLSTQTETALAITERRAEELAVINNLARTVSQQLNLDSILETVYRQLSRVLSVDAYIIGLYDQETNLINYPLIYDEGNRYEEGAHYLDKNTSIYEVLTTGESSMINYGSEDDLARGKTLEKNSLGNEDKPSKSMIFVPLIFSNYPVGVISVQSYHFNAFDDADLALVEGIASHLSVAIQNAQLFEQTQAALASTEEQASRLALLTELGQALTQAETLEEVYAVTAERAHKILDSHRTSIALLTDDGQHYDVLALGGEKASTKVGERQPLEGSNIAVAVQENRLVVINKTENSGISDIYAFMVAPLVASGRTIGTLNIGNKSTDVFGPRDERLLTQIASLLATTVESRRLLAQTQRRAEELAAINRIAQTISRAREQDLMLEAVLQELSKILPVDAFLISLYDEDSNLLEYPLVFDDGQRHSFPPDTPSANSTIAKILKNQEPTLILRTPEEVAEKTKNLPPTMVGNRSKVSASLMYIPLVLGKRSTGAFSIQSYEYNAYKPENLKLLEGVASHIAVALENARLFQETERRAEELSVVNQVAEVVSQLLELNDLYSAVHEQIQRAFVSDAFFIAIHNKETNTVSFPYLFDDGDRYVIDPIPANPKLEVMQVIETGEPILANFADPQNAEQDIPSDVLLASEKAPSSMIFVPLRSGLTPVGAISIQNYQSHPYNQSDVDLLSGIAYHLAVALENARLFSETEQRAEELAVINEIAQAVSRQIEQQELLETVYEQVKRIIPVDAFSVAVYQSETEMIHFVMMVDEGKQYQETPTPLGTGGFSRVIIEGQPILINRTQQQLDELAQEQNLVLIGNTQRLSASMIYAPLRIGTETIGGLSVHSYELNAYGEPEVELLVGVANHLAIALENARLFEETQATLAEAELLYNMGTQINRATTLEDLVKVVAVPGIAPHANSAGLFRFELDENGQAEWMELAANWAVEGGSVLEVGTRLHLPELPLAAAELYTPNDPMLIENIATDDRVDHAAKVLLRGLNTKAIAIIPMQQLDTWIGTLIIRWNEPYPFTIREHRLYNSLSRQMSTALSNQLLLTETQDRAAQLETVHQIETALSQADDEAGILESLAPLLTKDQVAGLHYTIEEDTPVTAVTVAQWENNQIKADDPLFYEPFEIEQHPGLALGLQKSDGISFISDIKSDVRLIKNAAAKAREKGYRAVMVIPLRSAGRWQGFVSITWPKTHEFSAAEASMWEQLREPLTAIIASRRAYLAQQDALSETAVLYETGAQLSTARSYNEVLEVIRDKTILGQDVSNVSIMLFEYGWRQGNMPTYADVLTFWSPTIPENANTRFYYDRYPSAEKILQTAQKSPVIFTDVQNSAELDEHLKQMLIKGFNADTYAIFPMAVRGEWIGYVNAMFPERTDFSEKDIRRAEAIIRQAGIAIQGLRNLEQAEHQALVAQNRSSELASINRVVSTVVSTFDLEEMLNVVAAELIELFTVQHVGITLINQERTILTVVADRSSDTDAESAVGLEIPLVGNELSNQVIETRKAVIVEDAQTNKLTEPVHDVMRWRGTQTLILLPLFSGRETIGTLGMDIVEKDRTFTEIELQLAETIVAQIATAVRNIQLFEQTETRAQELAVLNEESARLFEQAQARSEELVILNEMGRSLTALVDMDTILDNVYRYTARLMDAHNFYIAFWDIKRNEITFALDIRGDRVMRNVGTRKAGKGLTEYIIQSKEPILIPEKVDERLAELGIDQIGPQAASWLGVPLMVGSQVIGVIGLQNWEIPKTYNEQHLRLLTSVAGQAAIAIENARLFEQIQARARRERILREVTAKVRGATDADTVMRTAVQEIGRALGRQTFVYLSDNQEQMTDPMKEEAYGD